MCGVHGERIKSWKRAKGLRHRSILPFPAYSRRSFLVPLLSTRLSSLSTLQGAPTLRETIDVSFCQALFHHQTPKTKATSPPSVVAFRVSRERVIAEQRAVTDVETS